MTGNSPKPSLPITVAISAPDIASLIREREVSVCIGMFSLVWREISEITVASRAVVDNPRMKDAVLARG